MRLNKKELRKIQYDFNSYANRLLQADFNDYTGVLGKFLNFLENTPIIIDYIKDCGNCELDLVVEVQEVQRSFGRCIFSTGETEEEEVRNVYSILCHLVATNNSVYHAVAMGYSHSNNYQDKIKGFNERFVMVLIRHIERYLTKVGIDMGLDDKIIYNVTVENGQAIIAADNAVVNATNNVGIDVAELKKLITEVQAATSSLTPDEQENVFECLEVIETEASAKKPKVGMLKTALKTLGAIKGITEFGAAVAGLADFVTPLLLK